MTEQASKKRKVENGILRCTYMIIKRNRECGMVRSADKPFCPQHMLDEQDRMPCPLDPKHSIWKKDLNRHLKKCNSRPKEINEPWHTLDINHKIKGEQVTHTKLDTEISEEELFKKYIPVIKDAAKEYEPLEFSIKSHEGLNQRLEQVDNPKHPVQQSSLAGNLKLRNMLGTDHFYVEFGCGKAELSRFLNLCVLQEYKNEDSSNFGYGLIDRGLNRMKNDGKIRKETDIFNKTNGTSIQPQIKRSRIDIRDLDLDKFLEDCKYKSIVGISKHLCGVATDLTLRLIVNSSLIESGTLCGIAIAMCCRHVCSYDQLLPLSKEYLAGKGITSEAFRVMKKMVSWAICGSRTSTEDHGHPSGLNAVDREQMGFLARRLIDESRLHAVRSMLPEYHSTLLWYVEKDVTLENVCLMIEKK